MEHYRQIVQQYGGCLCRRCLNRELSAALRPRDCKYGYPLPALCPGCGEQRNIVTDLRVTGRLKLLVRRLKKPGRHAARR